MFRTTGQVLGVSLSGAILQALLLKYLKESITIPGSEDVCRDFILLKKTEDLLRIVNIVYSVRRLQTFITRAYMKTFSHSTSIIPTLDPPLREAAINAYASSLRVVFIFQAISNFFSFLMCLPIQENPLP